MAEKANGQEQPTNNEEKKENGENQENSENQVEPMELPPFEIISGYFMQCIGLAIMADPVDTCESVPCNAIGAQYRFISVDHVAIFNINCGDQRRTYRPNPTPIGDSTSSVQQKERGEGSQIQSSLQGLIPTVTIEVHGAEVETFQGYLEDEHISMHAEEAFFRDILPECNPEIRYHVTWYMSSSPCSACAAKIAEALKSRKNMRLTIMVARLFLWEEPEIQEGLRLLKASGCKLKIMKPSDFVYTWNTFVESEGQTFTPWEDVQENYEYHEKILDEILH
ncbi:ABEC2 enzyme, partial [Polypterus senegalus]|nr:ABEC2 enzyme [Polypterus senegalus]